MSKLEGVTYQSIHYNWGMNDERGKKDLHICIVGEESEQDIYLTKKQVKRLKREAIILKDYMSPKSIREEQTDDPLYFIEIKWDQPRKMFNIRVDYSPGCWQDSHVNHDQLMQILSIPSE